MLQFPQTSSDDRIQSARFQSVLASCKRGLTHDREFEQWANMVNPFSGDSAMDLVNYKKTLVLEFLNERGQVAFRYLLYNCWVSEYTAILELDANAKEDKETVALERIKIELEGWERDAEVQEPNEGG